MPVKDDFGNRMKEYEKRNRYYLQKRMPVIIRCDMRAGHTFTRGFQRPFDEIFMTSMQQTMQYMCENIQNAKFGYCESDEITIVLVDYEDIRTAAWFDYRTDKLCSIAASMATMAFNKFFAKNIQDIVYRTDDMDEYIDYYGDGQLIPTEKHYANILSKAAEKGAMFDARCFNIPKEEVTNCVYWRQLDATRNSIQMVGQANFSHRELQGKNCNQIQDMLHEQKNINWNDFPISQKRGSACIKQDGEWVIDLEMPILKGEDREYVDKLIYI